MDYVTDFSYFDRQEIGRHGQHGREVVIEVKGYKTDECWRRCASPCVTCATKIIVIQGASEKRNAPTATAGGAKGKKTKPTPDPARDPPLKSGTYQCPDFT